MVDIQVTGKNILVTGGANGIGLEIVKALAPYNNVFVVDRDAQKVMLLEQVANVKAACVDLADWDKTREVLDRLLPPLVHGVVNNAGIGAQAGFLDVTQADLDRVIAVNTRAIINVSQVVANRIITHNNQNENNKVTGSIVNVSSLASRFPTKISVAYNLTKAAVDMVTKGMALELGPFNIRVNSVNPNIVQTDLAQAWMDARGPQLKDRLMDRTPLRKFVHVDDVVNTVLFLLWDGVAMVHGESLFVDGGYSVS